MKHLAISQAQIGQAFLRCTSAREQIAWDKASPHLQELLTDMLTSKGEGEERPVLTQEVIGELLVSPMVLEDVRGTS